MAEQKLAWPFTGPKASKSKGELRTQFHHVIDVAPTILEAAGLPEPVEVNGVKQVPMSWNKYAVFV